ncbi:MAG: transcriptional repressor [Ruminiclostridium sp.]|nr:transcriptional repressor [Ruminiclostridium sp.]
MAAYKTANREALLHFLETHSGDPFTVRQITAEISADENHNAPSESTVYRFLRDLEKDGRVRKTIDPANREYMYIFEGENTGRVNMRCKVCGNVYAADRETSRRIIADAAGCGEIEPDDEIELIIKCKHCKKE